MNANTNYFSRLLISSCFITLLFSCESKAPKADDAYEKFKEEKIVAEDSIGSDSLKTADEKQIISIKKSDPSDEWAKFQAKTERKIVANEKTIKNLKSTPNVNAKILLRITRLEKDNNDLRTQMTTYKAEEKLRWQEFQASTLKNAADITTSLKEISASENK